MDPAPTPAQLTSLCAEAAAIARSWGWSAEDITIRTVMTHAEPASNRDGRVMHDNYGPSDGGEQLRHRIRALLRGDTSPAPASPLVFKGETVIQARGADLAV